MKLSSIIPALAIPLCGLMLVSCEVGRYINEENKDVVDHIDKDKEILTADQEKLKAEIDAAKEKRERLNLDLGDLNASIMKMEAQYIQLQTGEVTLGSYKSPGGGASAPAPSPEIAKINEGVTPTPPDAAAPTEGGGAARTDGMVDLVTEFPTPMFVGTPVPVKLPNLEPPGKPVKTMPVPAGTTNVAKGKPVTSSDPEPTIGELDFVTDGDKEGGDGFFVELGPGTQWVQIDLEKEYNIHAVFFWHFHKAACAYFDVIVQISNDPEFVNATTIYNNDHDNSSGMGVGADLAYIETNHGRLVDAKGARGRYVRLYSNGNTLNDLNHFIEVEVYATE